MVKNISVQEGGLRITLAVGVFMLWLFDVIAGNVLYILSIFSLMLLVSAFMNFCPLYKVLGISTHRCKENDSINDNIND